MALQDYQEIVATSAFITTMLHMFSGVAICRDIYKKGSATGIDPMTFIGGIGMCTLNLQYGLILRDPTMININIFGMLLNVLYMIFYYTYSSDKLSVLFQIGKAVIFVAFFIGYARIEHKDKIEHRFGMITTVLMIMLVASPLMHLKHIIRTKSTEGLPFPLIFMGTFVTFQWALYGVIINNFFLIFQNSLMFALSLFQLSLFIIYPSKSYSKLEDEDRKKDK